MQGQEIQGEFQQNQSPSDDWSSFSGSEFSIRHISEANKKTRTSNTLLTASNWAKLCIGITTISLSKSIEQTGIYLSIIGILYVTFVNLYSQYLLIQARDRFKHSIIVDIPELGVKLFGEKSRVWVSMVPIVENLSYCIAYNIFFGQQIDQLLCQYFQVAQCGQNNRYALIMNILLVPFVMINSMKTFGIISFCVLLLSSICFSAIVFDCSLIIFEPISVTDSYYGLKLSAQSQTYTTWNLYYLPQQIAIWMNILEGCQNILNVYAEHNNPKNYISIVYSVIIFVTLIDSLIAYLGYLAFGTQIQDVLIYNLPLFSIVSVVVKILYIICIAGSFLLMMQPVYYNIEGTDLYKRIANIQIGRQDQQQNEENRIDAEENISQEWSFRQNFTYFIIRVSFQVFILVLSFIIPDVNFVLTILGSTFGTLLMYVIPVFFYNKAYSNSANNMRLDRDALNNLNLQNQDNQDQIIEQRGQDESENENTNLINQNQQKRLDQDDYQEKYVDKRKYRRAFNYVFLIVGIILGTKSFFDAILPNKY